jgi:hypothetical protein
MAWLFLAALTVWFLKWVAEGITGMVSHFASAPVVHSIELALACLVVWLITYIKNNKG